MGGHDSLPFQERLLLCMARFESHAHSSAVLVAFLRVWDVLQLLWNSLRGQQSGVGVRVASKPPGDSSFWAPGTRAGDAVPSHLLESWTGGLILFVYRRIRRAWVSSSNPIPGGKVLLRSSFVLYQEPTMVCCESRGRHRSEASLIYVGKSTGSLLF